MNKEAIYAKLNKFLALAEQGVGGERVNAKAMLEKLMEKYNVSWEELTETGEPEMQWIKHGRSKMYDKLLTQVICQVLPDSRKMFTNPGRKYCTGVKVTSFELVEIEFRFDVYLTAYKKSLKEQEEVHFSAFIQKNKIYPPPSAEVDKERKPPTLEERQRNHKASSMMETMERVSVNKALS